MYNDNDFQDKGVVLIENVTRVINYVHVVLVGRQRRRIND